MVEQHRMNAFQDIAKQPIFCELVIIALGEHRLIEILDVYKRQVYVEEEAEDASCFGMPVYTMYKLEDYKADGSCTLYNPQTDERRGEMCIRDRS